MNDMSSPIETYRQEAEELLADIEESVLDLEVDPEDSECIDRLFRSMHTIKGSGAMFGFDDIADFTHHVETILDHVRNGKIGVSSKLIDLVLASRDHIKAMLNPSEDSASLGKARSEKLIEALYTLLPESGVEAESTGNSNTQEIRTDSEKSELKKQKTAFRIKFLPEPDIMKKGMEPGLLLNELRNMGDCAVMSRTDQVPGLDSMEAERCYLYWEVILITDRTNDEIQDVFIFVEEDSRISVKEIKSDQDSDILVPRLADILIKRGYASPEDVNEILEPYQEQIGESFIKSGIVSPTTIKSALLEQKIMSKGEEKTVTSSVRVSSDKLDNLINLVGELVITQARISQLTSGADEFEDIRVMEASETLEYLLSGLANPIETLERLTNDLRDCALNMRMLPIGTTFGKFRRMVRDLSSELGKEIELVTRGAETELDKTVIERLRDPLIHLIRNSIDHGIRSPDKREEFGKKRQGKILLIAEHRGPNVLITIEDDGMGMNPDAIRERALERGLTTPDSELSEDEIFSLVFTPGFSTAREVSSVSGRGVGLDVVKREIDALGGTIRISSKKGWYTRITMSLPLTLAIIEGLLVKVGNSSFILPLSQVEECTELTKSMIEKSHGRNMIMVREELIAFIRLKELFNISGKKTKTEHIAIVTENNSRVGIVSDEIIGNIQTVIKSLDRKYREAEGISGAAIMGDGTVALIIDIPGVVRSARYAEQKMFRQKGGQVCASPKRGDGFR